jgi:hypothetical protein
LIDFLATTYKVDVFTRPWPALSTVEQNIVGHSFWSIFDTPNSQGLRPYNATALIVGDAFGYPNTVQNELFGPFFAHKPLTDSGLFEVGGYTYIKGSTACESNCLGTDGYKIIDSPSGPSFLNNLNELTYLQAFAYSVPYNDNTQQVPAPMPVFGAAAAIGISRKLRKRVKGSANLVASSYTI